MNGNSALDRNRLALIGIVSMLVALAGVRQGTVERIQRAVRLQVLRILRPAEAAVRRLIFVAAQGLEMAPAVVRRDGDFRALRASGKTDRVPRPSFQLSDPRAPMRGHREAFFTARGIAIVRDKAPRIRMIAPIDPTVPALWAAQRAPEPKPDAEFVHTQSLVRRLQAISAALDDIPKQAKRLVRWTQRRERLFQQRPVYTSPLRAGPPPGSRKEPVHEVDRILAECHLRAFDARRTRPGPDTS